MPSAYLVGQEFDGLRQLFHMMNEPRIGGGLAATAQGCPGYLQALAYARTRLLGRSPSRGNDPAEEFPITPHPDVRRMLLAQRSSVEGALALGLYCGRLIDETLSAPTDAAREAARLLLEVLTPIAKRWPSQWCVEANSLAIQVHGGYGYTKLGQLHRGKRLNSIHDGTHGIPALDMLGRKVPRESGRGLQLLLANMRATANQASALADSLAGWATGLLSAARRLGTPLDCSASSVIPPPHLPMPRCTSRPSAMSRWPGSGCSRHLPPTARSGTSATVIACRTVFLPLRTGEDDRVVRPARQRCANHHHRDENWF